MFYGLCNQAASLCFQNKTPVIIISGNPSFLDCTHSSPHE